MKTPHGFALFLYLAKLFVLREKQTAVAKRIQVLRQADMFKSPVYYLPTAQILTSHLVSGEPLLPL